MRSFFYKFAMFMQGRYKMDQLNYVLIISAILLSIINAFPRSLIIYIIELLLIALFFFRFLSKNIYKRGAENRRFLLIWGKVRDFFVLQKNRIKEFKTHVYIKCPYCKAQLRVKRLNGKHKVRCPRCGESFEKKIHFGYKADKPKNGSEQRS